MLTFLVLTYCTSEFFISFVLSLSEVLHVYMYIYFLSNDNLQNSTYLQNKTC